MKKRIVVGVDNSAGATTALTWTAQYASAHGYRLEAVFVNGADRPESASPRRSDDAEAEFRVLVVQRILERCPGPDCTVRIIDAHRRGGLATALREASSGAEFLVVGEADSALHPNLVSDLSAPGGCPVVVVDSGGRPHGLTRQLADVEVAAGS